MMGLSHFVALWLSIATSMVMAFNKLDECSSSQLNSQSCGWLKPYDDYQQFKCLSKDEIKSLSQGKYVCEEPATHCWYHDCQLRLTNLGFGPVREQCKCKEQSQGFCKNPIDVSKERCIKLTTYNSWQWATCESSQNLLRKSHVGCPFPETHCWYPCQLEKFDEHSGKVSEECECSAANNLLTTSKIGCLFQLMIFIVVTKLLS